MIARCHGGRRRGRAHFGALVLALVWATLALPTDALAQISVEELEVHFQLNAARGPLTQFIPVRNELDRVQQVRVVLGDWQRDSLGRNEFLEPGTHPSSCRARYTVFPMTFQVAPKSVEYVRVTVDPAQDQSGCWSIAFFETIKPPPTGAEQSGSFVTIEVRTGVKIYVHPASAVRAGEITLADVVRGWRPREVAAGAPRDSVQVWQADVRFTSTGTEHLKVRASIEVRDLDGLLLQKVAAQDAFMTPGAIRDISIPLPDLAPGQYIAVLLVDYGGDEITAARVEFRIP